MHKMILTLYLSRIINTLGRKKKTLGQNKHQDGDNELSEIWFNTIEFAVKADSVYKH